MNINNLNTGFKLQTITSSKKKQALELKDLLAKLDETMDELMVQSYFGEEETTIAKV